MEETTQDANVQEGWNADGSLPPDLDPDREVSSDSQNAFPGTESEESPSAETLKTEEETSEEFEEEGEAEMEEEGGEEKEPPFHTHPRWQEMVQQQKETQSQLAELQAQLQQANDMANFYATQYNEAVGLGQVKPQQEGQPQPGQQEAAKPELPIQALEPEKWSTQTDFANYTKAQVNELRGLVEPSLQRMSQQLGAVMEWVIKANKPDYDEVVKKTHEDIFNLDPSGRATGLKNQALFNYFNAHPFPHLAMYEHGLRKTAPDRIKQGVQQNTKKTLQQLGKKPKGPTKPGTTTGKTDRQSFWTSKDKWSPLPGKLEEKELDDAGLL